MTPPRSQRVEVVTFDLRRNLINVLGEDHYPYAEFLYHELVANAWDEDATEVQIVEETVRAGSPSGPALYTITIADNGNGMDLDGLREYFTVGYSGKPTRGRSIRYDRAMIGRLGVGKVSILKAARAWTVTTERHLGLDEPVRLTVGVDVDAWIDGDLPGFAVQYIEPTGRPGTEIVLEGVTTRFRQDRILRHLQRLPLGDDFRVWRNGSPIPPRQWHGIDKIDVDEEVQWNARGEQRSGRIRGEIWIRPEVPKREQAFVAEPKSESEALERDPAGIEVRVDRDMIVREFFGHETHGHQVNRIWGWVEVPWLPIVGNRTDYLRDSPEGQAFYNAVKARFDEAFNRVRYEKEARAKRRRESKAAGDASGDPAGADGTAAAATTGADAYPSDSGDGAGAETDLLASKLGEVVSEVIANMPEVAPVIDLPALTKRGRPAKDRIYPARPTGTRGLFAPSTYGEEVALTSVSESAEFSVPTKGHADTSADDATVDVEFATVTRNTAAGIRIRFVSLGQLEATYRWNTEDSAELSLDINTDHQLYTHVDKPGSPTHKLLCAWTVALALAQRQSVGGDRLADTVEDVAYEIYTRSAKKRF